MTGIAATGCFVPRYRLPLALLQGAAAEAESPERSVVWFDEDSVTMGVAAARVCLRDSSRASIDLVIFATTTYAYAEKQGAMLIVQALGLEARCRAIDVGHSLGGGTQALLMALDAVASGSSHEALVVAADCREGAPGSELERNGGDAAVAFLIRREGAQARLVARARHGEELVDVWRREGDRWSHSWEERFVVSQGYLQPMQRAMEALRSQTHGEEGDRHWALSAPDARSHATLARSLGIPAARLADPLFGTVGYCGTAHALLQFAAALASARPGQSLLVATHGDGAEVLQFKVEMAGQAAVPMTASSWRREGERVRTLAAWQRVRGLLPAEYAAPDDQGISATVHYREREENLGFVGHRCACGVPQFPRGRVCGACGRRDAWRPERYSEKTGVLLTYTLDAFHPTPESPTAAGIIAIDGGPRVHLQLADIAPREVRVGLRVRFVFRRIHEAGGRPNYYWKAAPIAGAGP
jgi:3-hydroxy-3-methylglutaryl CoA synthase/uncharacterized OB-fold protein